MLKLIAIFYGPVIHWDTLGQRHPTFWTVGWMTDVGSGYGPDPIPPQSSIWYVGPRYLACGAPTGLEDLAAGKWKFMLPLLSHFWTLGKLCGLDDTTL